MKTHKQFKIEDRAFIGRTVHKKPYCTVGVVLKSG